MLLASGLTGRREEVLKDSTAYIRFPVEGNRPPVRALPKGYHLTQDGKGLQDRLKSSFGEEGGICSHWRKTGGHYIDRVQRQEHSGHHHHWHGRDDHRHEARCQNRSPNALNDGSEVPALIGHICMIFAPGALAGPS
jgi:hypothetical protein